jgi:hypothetical protein
MSKSSQLSGKYTYKHSMRRIELTYMPGKTVMTTEDEQLVEKYIQLHDFEYHLLKKTEELHMSFCEIDKQVNTLRECLTDIKNKLNDSVTIADKLSEDSYIPAETSIEKIKENNISIAVELSLYHEKLNSLYKEVRYNQGILNNCINTAENRSEKIYAEYSSVSDTHNQNYEINTIDIVSLDSDYEKFCNSRELYEKRRNDFMERCDKILNRYNSLDLETNAWYQVWTEFSKRCELIQVMANLHRSNISASNN